MEQVLKRIPKPDIFPKVFRAYDVDRDVMYSPEELDIMGVVMSPSGKLLRNQNFEKLNLIPLYYSGKHDSVGGRPLFDGDICKVGVKFDQGMPLLIEKYGIMRWNRNLSSFQLHILAQDPKGNYECVESELIGNEYKDKELLKKIMQ